MSNEASLQDDDINRTSLLLRHCNRGRRLSHASQGHTSLQRQASDGQMAAEGTSGSYYSRLDCALQAHPLQPTTSIVG